jgi:hypothetical protein
MLSASLDDRLSAAVTRGDVPGLVAMAATRERIFTPLRMSDTSCSVLG